MIRHRAVRSMMRAQTRRLPAPGRTYTFGYPVSHERGKKQYFDAKMAWTPAAAHVEGLKIERNATARAVFISRPDSLNALDLTAVRSLRKYLSNVRTNNSVQFILLSSETEDLFSAGLDLSFLRARLQQRGSNSDEIAEYFREIQELAYEVSTFNKPLVSAASGLTVGYGASLARASEYMYSTELSVMAFPEVHLGLVPHGGASYRLSRMEDGLGMYLALTGAAVRGSDLYWMGISDFHTNSSMVNEMLLDSAGHSLGNSLFAAQMEADPVRKQNLEYLVSQREFESYQYVHEEAMQRGVSQEEFDEYVRLKAWHKFIRLGDKTSAKQIIQEEGQQEIEWSRIDSGALFNFASDDAFSDRAMVAEPHAVGRSRTVDMAVSAAHEAYAADGSLDNGPSAALAERMAAIKRCFGGDASKGDAVLTVDTPISRRVYTRSYWLEKGRNQSLPSDWETKVGGVHEVVMQVFENMTLVPDEIEVNRIVEAVREGVTRTWPFASLDDVSLDDLCHEHDVPDRKEIYDVVLNAIILSTSTALDIPAWALVDPTRVQTEFEALQDAFHQKLLVQVGHRQESDMWVPMDELEVNGRAVLDMAEAAPLEVLGPHEMRDPVVKGSPSQQQKTKAPRRPHLFRGETAERIIDNAVRRLDEISEQAKDSPMQQIATGVINTVDMASTMNLDIYGNAGSDSSIPMEAYSLVTPEDEAGGASGSSSSGKAADANASGSKPSKPSQLFGGGKASAGVPDLHPQSVKEFAATSDKEFYPLEKRWHYWVEQNVAAELDGIDNSAGLTLGELRPHGLTADSKPESETATMQRVAKEMDWYFGNKGKDAQELAADALRSATLPAGLRRDVSPEELASVGLPILRKIQYVTADGVTEQMADLDDEDEVSMYIRKVAQTSAVGAVGPYAGRRARTLAEKRRADAFDTAQFNLPFDEEQDGYLGRSALGGLKYDPVNDPECGLLESISDQVAAMPDVAAGDASESDASDSENERAVPSSRGSRGQHTLGSDSPVSTGDNWQRTFELQLGNPAEHQEPSSAEQLKHLARVQSDPHLFVRAFGLPETDETVTVGRMVAQAHKENVASATAVPQVRSVEEIERRLEAENSDWARETLQAMRSASPLARQLTHRLLVEASTKSRYECFQMEHRVLSRLINSEDLAAGLTGPDSGVAPVWTSNGTTATDVDSYFARLPRGEELKLRRNARSYSEHREDALRRHAESLEKHIDNGEMGGYYGQLMRNRIVPDNMHAPALTHELDETEDIRLQLHRKLPKI